MLCHAWNMFSEKSNNFLHFISSDLTHLFNSYSHRTDSQYDHGVPERQHRESMENGDGIGEVCFQKWLFVDLIVN